MELSSEISLFIKENNCRFISLKYLGQDNILTQVDIAVKNISLLKNILAQKQINLKPIPNKYFLDPFRSMPTITIFCDNLQNDLLRPTLKQIFNAAPLKKLTDFIAEISFWLNDEIDSNTFNNSYTDDLNINLRAEIVQILEQINIPTTVHYYDIIQNKSVIGINGNSLLDLADNILIANFIISNCAASYGKKVCFWQQDKSNLLVLISGFDDEHSELHSIITSRLDKVCRYSDNITQFKFEIKKYRHYPIDDKLLQYIEIKTHNNYIPYNLLQKIFDDE